MKSRNKLITALFTTSLLGSALSLSAQTTYYWNQNGTAAGWDNPAAPPNNTRTWNTTNAFFTTTDNPTAAGVAATTTVNDTLNIGTNTVGTGANQSDITATSQSIGTVITGSANLGELVLRSATFAAAGTITNNSSREFFLGPMFGAASSFNLNANGGGFTLFGANTYTGITFVNTGVVTSNENTSLGAGGTNATRTVVASGARLAFNNSPRANNEHFEIAGAGVGGTTGALTYGINGTLGLSGVVTLANAATVYSSNGTTTFSGGFTLGSNVLTFNVVGGSQVIGTAGIAGSGSVVKSGANALSLNFANTYTGGTTLSAGTINIGTATTALGSTSGQLTVNGGTLNMASHSITVGNLTGTGGTIQGTSGTRTLTIGQGDTGGGNFQGIIANGTGTTALTKVGTGVSTLSGTNTYTGATAINGGTLQINGNQSAATGAVTVASGASLAGEGTIGGTVTLTDGGNIVPGNSGVGTLNLNSDFNIEAQASDTGKLNFELASIAASDKIAVGGALNIGTEVLGFNDFDFSPLSGLENGTYKLITAAAGVVGSLDTANNLANLTGTIGAGPAQGTLQITGNDLELVVSGVGVGDPFTTWSSGAAFDDDANNDGVANGLAWLLGAANPNDNATALLPQTTLLPGGDLKINFSMRKAADRDGATVQIEHSSDLGLDDLWSVGVTVPEATGGSAPVTFTVDSSGALNVVEATISASEANAGKLFGRLKAQR